MYDTLFYHKLTGESLMQDLLRRQPGTVPRKWGCVYYVRRPLIRGYLDNLLMDRQHSFHPIRHRYSGILILRELPILTLIHFTTFVIVKRVLILFFLPFILWINKPGLRSCWLNVQGVCMDWKVTVSSWNSYEHNSIASF